jgi:uncharacterized coiled-coil DUF342 family protein
MVSEIHQLSEKLDRLVELTNALRQENAALRETVSALQSENAELNSRIDEACVRVASLLEKIPAASPQQEEAA